MTGREAPSVAILISLGHIDGYRLPFQPR